MSSVIQREFDMFFQSKDEAIARASEYMNSNRPKSVDRNIVLAASAMAAVLASMSYVIQYSLGLSSDERLGSTSLIVVVCVAAIFLRPKWQADAARRYIEETFGPRAPETK